MTERIAIRELDTIPRLLATGDTTRTYLVVTPYNSHWYAAAYQWESDNPIDDAMHYNCEVVVPVHGHPDEYQMRTFLTTGAGQKLLQRLAVGTGQRYNGERWVGEFTDDAAAARAELVEQLSDPLLFTRHWTLEPAHEYVDPDCVVAEDDYEIAALYAHIVREAAREYVVIAGDLLALLREYWQTARYGAKEE